MAECKIWKRLVGENYKHAMCASAVLESPVDQIQLRQRLATEGQKPFAAILTCSDSRVSPESIFRTKLGDLFIVRIAGNIVSSEVVASFEFAVAILGVKLLVILGHSECGAVMSALKTSAKKKSAENALDKLVNQIAEILVSEGVQDLPTAIKTNTAKNAEILLERSDYLRTMYTTKRISLVTAEYDIHSGRVKSLN